MQKAVWQPLILTLISVIVMVFALRMQGRVWWCQVGDLLPGRVIFGQPIILSTYLIHTVLRIFFTG